VTDNNKSTRLLHYGIYYGRKKFYDTSSSTNKPQRLIATVQSNVRE